MRANGGEHADLVQPINRQVNFTFSGIDQPFLVGQSATLTVLASNSAGRALPVVCDLPWQPYDQGQRRVSRGIAAARARADYIQPARSRATVG